ncbi:hypothetical protein AtNW77_Chr1g0062391 [Arabidopsis thaliana]|uniref:Uncharacterized protein n=2 Tax=Arabidopsis TaxID=3701 RepID=A0A178W7R8_ARATH|nr:hypothetical protein ISN45_At01g052980 [Arabidopsis thaliana x Arabidopsis arenosa]OAP13791.1 hypothetical protein AXX17_AT1G55980 [Arabidopsis thaliana]
MRYKRRFVTVYRDFPEGCGVPSKPIANGDESFMQSKFNKDGIVLQAHKDFSEITKESSNHSETENSRTEDLLDEGSVLDSNGSVTDCQENREREMSSVKKRCLSSHNLTSEVETERIGIVLGLAAKAKCPWRQPKIRGSRQVNGLN